MSVASAQELPGASWDRKKACPWCRPAIDSSGPLSRPDSSNTSSMHWHLGTVGPRWPPRQSSPILFLRTSEGIEYIPAKIPCSLVFILLGLTSALPVRWIVTGPGIFLFQTHRSSAFTFLGPGLQIGNHFHAFVGTWVGCACADGDILAELPSVVSRPPP